MRSAQSFLDPRQQIHVLVQDGKNQGSLSGAMDTEGGVSENGLQSSLSRLQRP